MKQMMQFKDIRPGDSWVEGTSRCTVISVTPYSINKLNVSVTFSREINGAAKLETADINAALVWEIHRPEPEATPEELAEAKKALEDWLQ